MRTREISARNLSEPGRKISGRSPRRQSRGNREPRLRRRPPAGPRTRRQPAIARPAGPALPGHGRGHPHRRAAGPANPNGLQRGHRGHRRRPRLHLPMGRPALAHPSEAPPPDHHRTPRRRAGDRPTRTRAPGQASRDREPNRPSGGDTVNPDATPDHPDTPNRTQETRHPDRPPAATRHQDRTTSTGTGRQPGDPRPFGDAAYPGPAPAMSTGTVRSRPCSRRSRRSPALDWRRDPQRQMSWHVEFAAALRADDLRRRGVPAVGVQGEDRRLVGIAPRQQCRDHRVEVERGNGLVRGRQPARPRGCARRPPGRSECVGRRRYSFSWPLHYQPCLRR
jgi:hypothetical protein